jgi:PKD repeat protein
MKPTFNITLIILVALTLTAQKYDYNWYTGYRFREDTIQPDFGITHWDFNTSNLNPKFSYDTFKHIDFGRTINNMSDYDGNFLFSYNGGYIENYNNNPIPNGRLTIEDPFEVFNQLAVILPSPLNNTEYNLFYKVYYSNGIFAASTEIFSSKVFIDNYKEGKIFNFAKKLFIDTLQLVGVNAIKHSNGKDWWIVDSGNFNTNYYSILVRDQNIIKIVKGFTPLFFKNYINQTVFSADGKYFATSSIYPHVDSTKSHVSLFHFDRATGVISGTKYFFFDFKYAYQMLGVAFSPNSKFLYISRLDDIIQVDLTDSTLPVEQVAVYDGYIDGPVRGSTAPSAFGMMQIAPDGRIYGTTSAAQQRKLFYINKPNLKGKACDVRQHAINITMHGNLPTFPNYRLGPIDGSPSDSLGIDNIPVAEFRYDQDTMNYRSIDFTNLSWYEPEEFWWDWGDGSQPYYTTVWDTSIIHTYAKDGIYEVCLRAKNKNGETTKCKKINIGTTATKDEANNPLIDIALSPNPMREILIIQVNDYLPEKMIMNLYDLQGNKITTKKLYEGSNIINTESLSSGVYIVEIIERNRIVKSEKIVKI